MFATKFDSISVLFVLLIAIVLIDDPLKQAQGQFISQYPRARSKYDVYNYDIQAMQNRLAQFPIHPMILARRSLRDMDGHSIPERTLMSLFEAARWAPSYHNVQSWRFIYSKRGDRYWNKFLETLAPGNKKWAQNAAALIVVVSNRYQIHKGEKKRVDSATFDTGAAWMSMALEGTARGLVVHPMTGFDHEEIADITGLNTDEYKIELMVAVGNKARQITNEKTTQRNEIDKFVSHGIFKEKVFV